MRPRCPYCDRKAPHLIVIAVGCGGRIVDTCCRLCEAAFQFDRFLWGTGSGWTRRPQ